VSRATNRDVYGQESSKDHRNRAEKLVMFKVRKKPRGGHSRAWETLVKAANKFQEKKKE